MYRFQLFVAGDGPHSHQAVANLRVLCREHLVGRHEVEIIDILKDPMRALTDGVMLTPLLVKLSPGPAQRIVGNLSQREKVLEALDIDHG